MPSKYKNTVFGIKILSIPYQVNDIYGVRQWRKDKWGGVGMHNGIDLHAPLGTEIKTPYGGICEVYPENTQGNILKIKHDTGFMTEYHHLQSFNVTHGQTVTAGTVVALSGNTSGTGGRSTGPHLHLGVTVDGQKADPAPYLFGYALKDGKNKKFDFDPSVKFETKSTEGYDELLKFINTLQLSNAQIIVDVCYKAGCTQRDAIITIMTSLQESNLQNLNVAPDGTDNIGLFGQRPSKGWGTVAQILDPNFSTNSFLNGIGKNKGLLAIPKVYRESLQPYRCCQLVQWDIHDLYGADALNYAKWELPAKRLVEFLWPITDISTSILNLYGTEKEDGIVSEEVEIEDYIAPGIWQAIKVVIDPEVQERQINDATISFMQGSLFSFFGKVCQQPFVEFWGDTYGDQYYFIIRKPPFTRQSFLSLSLLNIYERDVYSDSFVWENQEIYSWYMLEPNGNYIGGNEVIFQYLQAVFFTEYAELWGSKPLSITSNYITFIKETGDIQLKAAEQDLKFIVDCHSYLPFVRKGTITIRGDRRIKRGMKIWYQPTNEYFYVESVSNSFTVQDGIIDRITTLTVSHGMIKEYADIEIEDKYTPSYFNLINYGPGQYNEAPKKDEGFVKPPDAPLIDRHIAYFNHDEYVFTYEDIDVDTGLDIKSGDLFLETSVPDSETEELKITKKIVDSNFENCRKIADYLRKYPNYKFDIVGNTDEHNTDQYNISLGENRAKTIRNIIIQMYNEKNLSIPEQNESMLSVNYVNNTPELEARLRIRTDGEAKPASDNKNPLGRLKNRRVDIYYENELDVIKSKNKEIKKENVTPSQTNKWSVNKEVFTFFVRKDQFNQTVQKNTTK